MIHEEIKSFATVHTFQTRKGENLYKKFRESREVIGSIVWRVETVLQLANQILPCLLTLRSTRLATSSCACDKLSVLQGAVREKNKPITPMTKASLQAVHNCVGPYWVCMCVCESESEWLRIRIDFTAIRTQGFYVAHDCACVCVCVCECCVGSVLMVGQCKQIGNEPDEGM